MTRPELITEVDFTGNPTAAYTDLIRNTDGLVSYWRMADSGAVLTDLKGVNNGVIEGTPSLVAGALPNDSDQALSFNGTNTNAYVPSSSTLATAGDFTLEGWVKFSSLSGAVKVLAGKQGSWSVSIDAAGKLRWFLVNDNNSALVTTGAPILSGGYYHLVCVHDSLNDLVKIYLNGILDQSAAFTFGPEINDQPLRFAGFSATTSPTRQASTTNNGVSTTPTGNAPASIASGNLLYAQVVSNGVGSAMTAEPTGWILRSIKVQGTFVVRTYYKIATGSEPATYVWTLASSENWIVAVTRITGQSALAPFANAQYLAATSGTSHATGSHTPAQDNNLVMALFANTAGGTWTEGGFGTEAYDAAGTGISLAMASAIQASAAAVSVTGTSSVTGTGVAIMEVIAGTGLGYTAVQEDEWSFWGRTLSDTEVFAHFQARLSGVGAWQELKSNGSSDARGLTVSYGRQYELNKVEAGTAATTLRNQHRRYDPANTNSPYSPNVKPNRKIRFRALLNGVYYPLFQGFVERWPPKWELPNYDEVPLTITDGFKALNRAGVSGTLDAALSGTQIAVLANKAMWPADARALDAGLFVLATDTSTGTVEAGSVMQDIADSELGILLFNHTVAGSPLTFHDRAHRWSNSRSITSQATFSDDGTFIAHHGLVPSEDDVNMVNEWDVTTAGGVLRSAVDVVSRSENFPVTKQRSTRLDNPSDAQTQATALLQQTSKPNLRFESITLKLSDQTPLAVWQKALTLAISDRVTVIRNPVPSAGGSKVTKDCFIEAIAWTITPELWTVAWQLSPVATAGYRETVLLDQPVSYWPMDTTT